MGKTTSFQKFGTAQEVQWIQNNTLAAFNKYNNELDEGYKEIKKMELERLQSLKSYLDQTMLPKLKAIGITKEKLPMINSCIKRWNNSGADAFLNNGGKIWSIISNLSSKYSSEATNIILEAFNNSQSSILDKVAIDEIQNGQLTEEVAQIIKANLDIVEENTKNHNISTIKKYIKIENKKGKLNFTFSKNISTYYQSEISRMVLKNWEDLEVKNIDFSDSKKVIDVIFNQSGIKLSPPSSIYIKKELTERIGAYGFNKDRMTQIGALGEIYWTAFFEYLFEATGVKANVVPQGTKKVEELGNVSSPIDLMINDIGIQIKNYSLSKDVNLSTNSFSKESMTIYGYLNRANFNSEANTFSDFIHSWNYNIPVEDATAEYYDIFNQFENIMLSLENPLENMGRMRIDKLIKMDTIVQQNIEGTLPANQLVNSIYLVRDKIIFSSDIIQALIDMLQGENQKEIITFETNLQRNYEIDIDGKANNWPKQFNPSGRPYSFYKIGYTLKFQIGELLSKVLQQSN